MLEALPLACADRLMDSGVPCAPRRRTVKGSVRKPWRTRGSCPLVSPPIAHREKARFNFQVPSRPLGLFSDRYQNAYHTQEYVFSTYSKYSRILEYIPHGLDSCQDIVLLQTS
jgi:hypothetical protein